MADTTVKRSVSLPRELDERLARETNASAFVTDLLQREFTRLDFFADGQTRHEYRSQRDSRVYRFTGKYLDQDGQGSYFAQDDGSLVFVDADDHPYVVEPSEIEEWFGAEPTAPEVVLEAFDIQIVVDLDAS